MEVLVNSQRPSGLEDCVSEKAIVMVGRVCNEGREDTEATEITGLSLMRVGIRTVQMICKRVGGTKGQSLHWLYAPLLRSNSLSLTLDSTTYSLPCNLGPGTWCS